MKNIELYSEEKVDTLVWPDIYRQVTEDSPALSVLTDFKLNEPLVIDANAKAVAAVKMMLNADVWLKLVVDHNGAFLGIVSRDDLSEQKIMEKVAEGYDRPSLMVSDLMRKRQLIKVFEYSELAYASVRDVIKTMTKFGQLDCLVVDRSKHHIRGIISTTEITRKLNIPIYIQELPNFGEMVKALSHH